MKIKFLFYFLFLVLIGGGSFLIFSNTTNASVDTCAFCNQDVLDRQTFYEDELVLALCTYKPIFPGHCLIIPKRHVERFEDLTASEISRMGEVLKKVNLAAMETFDTSSYLLLQKNGKEAGQTVPHVHIHYIPREAGDESTLKFVYKMFVANLKKPISHSKTKELAGKMKSAMH